MVSGEGLIEDYPNQAKAGEVITLHTLTITDADLYVSVNDDEERGSFTEEGVYQFVMPESDVTIKAWVVPNELAEDIYEEDTEAEEIEETSTEETGTNETGTGKSGGKLPSGDSSSTSTRKKKSTAATTEVDPDDHDIEAYYDDNRDEYDSFEDAWDGFEDDEDAWDDY